MMPIVAYQTLAVLIVLLPLFETIGFTVYWRAALSNYWLYGLTGCVATYVVIGALVFAIENFTTGGITGVSGYFLEQAKPGLTEPKTQPVFASLETRLLGLMVLTLVVCGAVLWVLTFAFRRPGL